MDKSSQKTKNCKNTNFHWTDKALGILVLAIILFMATSKNFVFIQKSHNS